MESLKWVAEKACEGWVLVLPLVWIMYEFWVRLS